MGRSSNLMSWRWRSSPSKLARSGYQPTDLPVSSPSLINYKKLFLFLPQLPVLETENKKNNIFSVTTNFNSNFFNSVEGGQIIFEECEGETCLAASLSRLRSCLSSFRAQFSLKIKPKSAFLPYEWNLT